MTQGGPEAPPTCYRHPDRETWIRCQRCDRSICPDCMRSAAVGFQCPECVAEGARSTRQLRTPYGGKRVDDPRLTSFVLIGINVAVFVAVLVTGGRISRLVEWLALLPLGRCEAPGGGYYPGAASAAVCGSRGEWVLGVATGAPWQLLTSAFLHVQPLHIAFNMMALYFLGPTLESVLGRVRYLALYLVSALAGSAAVMALSASSSQTLGASGAVFGLMGALAVVALKARGEAQQVLVWIGLNLVITFVVPGISWQGHLGGLAAGAVLGAAMVYAPRQRRSLVQWSAVGAVALLAALVIGLRVLALT